MIRTGGGWSAVINPHGQIIAGPVTEKETILIADIDLEEIVNAKGFCDSVGHYARPDVARIVVNREKSSVMVTQRMLNKGPILADDSDASNRKEVEFT